MATTYILAGAQTDFARKWAVEGLGLVDMLREVSQEALTSAQVEATQVGAAHIGNFVGERFCGQGHLGGALVEACPELVGTPTWRHEAACASGGVALMAAMASIESGRADLALVVGVEMMRNLPGREAQALLDAAALVPQETAGVEFVWPRVFGEVGELYREFGGLRREHLVALARSNFANARRNPRAQTRRWKLDDTHFSTSDGANPTIVPGIRRHDCSQLTDGAAALLLASPRFASIWAKQRGHTLAHVPRIRGWGHRTDRLSFASKVERFRAGGGCGYLFPQVRGAITDALNRAAIAEPAKQLRALEVHDCFTPTHLMAIDHFGLTTRGHAYRLVEDGTVLFDGALPVNPSGGLMGGGHPVGATGVRMVVDAWRQVGGTAGNYQVPAALGGPVATLNLGGSATTCVCTIISAGDDDA